LAFTLPRGALPALLFFATCLSFSVTALEHIAGRRTDYDAFGTLIDRTGSTDNSFLYCGERWDANLGFYYLRARYMNPGTGRFWTMDEMNKGRAAGLSLHRYLYALATPVNDQDPSGYMSVGEMVSVTNTIMNVTVRLLNVVSKVYKVKNALQSLKSFIDFLGMAKMFLAEILSASTPGEAVTALQTTLLHIMGGGGGFSPAQFMDSFTETIAGIGDHWPKIQKAVLDSMPKIMGELATRLTTRFGKLVVDAATGKDMPIIIDLPSPPVGSPPTMYMPVKFGKANLAMHLWRPNGRLVGVGLDDGTIDARGLRGLTLVRFDYYDVRPQKQCFDLHYHLLDDPPNHPDSDRTIWKP
jgi:RHS repeat-associated protein